MEQHSEQNIDAIRRGYLIANHSFTHPDFSKASLDQCTEEIKRTDTLIEALYRASGQVRSAKCFRFPYGDKGELKNGSVFNRWKKEDPQRKKYIQDILRELDYQQPEFEPIKYRFVKRAKLWDNVDWSWIFDLMEWALLEDRVA